MDRKIEVSPGVNLHVEDLGAGTPIVFIHGWPVCHRMFEYQFNRLPERGYRCIGLDLRGFGASDKPWEGYSYDALADDVRVVLDALDLTEAGLVGFSMGGAVAIRYLSRHAGARIAKLALLGAAAPSFTRRQDFPYGLDPAAVDDLIRQCYVDRPSMIADFGKVFFNEPVSPDFRSWFDGLALAASGHAMAACAIALRDADLRPDLAAIRVPTLILHAAHDRVCRFGLADALHQGITGSQLIRFAKGGHGFFYEDRDRVNDELGQFFARAIEAA